MKKLNSIVFCTYTDIEQSDPDLSVRHSQAILVSKLLRQIANA